MLTCFFQWMFDSFVFAVKPGHFKRVSCLCLLLPEETLMAPFLFSQTDDVIRTASSQGSALSGRYITSCAPLSSAHFGPVPVSTLADSQTLRPGPPGLCPLSLRLFESLMSTFLQNYPQFITL